MAPLLHELLPDVRAFFGALRPQAQQHVGGVGGAVDSLHRGDDAELPEARDILRAEVLGVLDAPAQVLLVGMLPKDPFVDVEGLAVGAVADGVDAKLVAVLDGQLAGALDVGRILHVQAAAVGLVGVGREQPGAARAERAIHVALDGADREIIAARADGPVSIELGPQLGVRAAQHHPDAQAQLVVLGHTADDIGGGRAASRHPRTW